MSLNVLHISESDAAGGAARTAYKVHRGLKEQGHVSRMLVGRKVTADDDIRRIKRHDGWRGLICPASRSRRDSRDWSSRPSMPPRRRWHQASTSTA